MIKCDRLDESIINNLKKGKKGRTKDKKYRNKKIYEVLKYHNQKICCFLEK